MINPFLSSRGTTRSRHGSSIATTIFRVKKTGATRFGKGVTLSKQNDDQHFSVG
ncbi:MAG TPA: hypothetical protein VE978_07670 [Chitinophagales bacterium]|nr:hypothetical protein [Chitinophagales bacterium]